MSPKGQVARAGASAHSPWMLATQRHRSSEASFDRRRWTIATFCFRSWSANSTLSVRTARKASERQKVAHPSGSPVRGTNSPTKPSAPRALLTCSNPSTSLRERERERERERGDDVRTAPWRARLSAQETAGQVALEGEEEVLLSGPSRLGSPRPDRRVWLVFFCDLPAGGSHLQAHDVWLA